MQRQLPLFSAAPAAAEAATTYTGLPIYRVALVREAALKIDRPQLRRAADAAALLRQFLGAVDREHFVVMMVDRTNRLIGINTVSIGSLDAAIVHPRECFKPAILSNAAAVILGHNHPSGAVQPSHEDRVLTTRLVDAGTLLGIAVLDHVIVGDGTEASYSFADQQALYNTTGRWAWPAPSHSPALACSEQGAFHGTRHL